MIVEAAQALAASPLGNFMRQSAWAYPLANVMHLFGLALLAGGIMAVDLAVLGAIRRVPIGTMSALLTPYAVAGIGLFAVSGFAMLAADAVTLIGQPIFLAKIAIVALATSNALVFRWLWQGRVAGWGVNAPAPARVLAAVSLALWSAAIILGRMIAYS